MPTLILGALVLLLALWALGRISRMDSKIAARIVRASGGILAIAVAGFLFLRGEIGFAIPLGLFGLGLVGWLPGWAKALRGGGAPSRFRSAFLDMEFGGDGRSAEGRFIAGRHAGVALSSLDRATLIRALGEIDGDSRALLAAYLDRRHAGWREHAQGDATAGRSAASSGKMTQEEAYQILGLQPGAGAADITRAHRALMKKLHPDHGGSTYLAARVNEAKEILFRKHR